MTAGSAAPLFLAIALIGMMWVRRLPLGVRWLAGAGACLAFFIAALVAFVHLL